MRILIVTAHPNRDSLSSFISFEAKKYLEEKEHQVRVFDLYEMGFDPVATSIYIERDSKELSQEAMYHRESIQWADGFVFAYPIWWWERPAILKGWFDCHFIVGLTMHAEGRSHKSLLKGKVALVFQTCGDTFENVQSNQAQEVFQGTLTKGTLNLCGIEVEGIETFYQARRNSLSLIEEIKTKTVNKLSLWDNR